MSGDGPVSSDDGLAEGPVEAYFDAGEGRSVVLFAPARGGRPLADEATQGQGLPVGKATRVLLIDQIEDDVALVRDLLARAEGAAFLVRHTEDPRDGLSGLLRGDHDVVLIEHQLSGEDGLAFTRAAARRGLTTPLILLSAAGPAGLDIAAIEAGAADFLDKEELDVERLERAIRLALARQRRSARLEAPPLHDPLTGLASRNAYLDRLEQALARARRRRQLAAVMLVDLDRFAAINQRLGHVAGDSILRLLGGRLRRHLRGTDTTARLAADHFALILEDLSRPEHAGTVALKLLAAIASPVAIGDETVTLTASMGASLFPNDATEVAGLLRLAETALEAAKLEGGLLPPCARKVPVVPAC